MRKKNKNILTVIAKNKLKAGDAVIIENGYARKAVKSDNGYRFTVLEIVEEPPKD